MNLGLLEGFCPAAPSGVLETALCFVATWEIPIFLLGAGVIAVVWWLRVGSQREAPQHGPMLVFPLDGSGRGPRPAAGDEVDKRRGPPPRRDRNPDDGKVHPPRGRPAVDKPESTAPPTGRDAPDPTERTVLRPSEADSRVPSGAGKASQKPEAQEGSGVVRYQRPPDGTLQLLPGRLQIERGPGQGEEIRFVRIPGSPAEVTIGRAEGPEYRHVQLDSPTVSRTHARLRFDGRQWTLHNESSTNPTRVNDRTLSSDIEQVPLSDGDTLEIGEITFRFRHEAMADRLAFRSSWYTDQGRRPTNQDAVIVRTLADGRELAAVCDGMGSHHAGGVASHRALEGLVASLAEGAGLEAAVQRANEAVLEAAAEEEEREGMGTTLVALLRDGDQYDLANVGDSRAYRVGPDGIEQLTVDHSFMAEAMREGSMSKEEAARSPWRNAVTRNLGADSSIQVDLFKGFDATADHVVFLSTDGVHGVLDPEELEEVVRGVDDIRDLARSLAEEALLKGGTDNVAVAALALGNLSFASATSTTSS